VFAKRPRRIDQTFALASLCAVIGCALGCASGCTSREALKLHYLNGIVPQTHAVFLPANIAVAPVGGELTVGSPDVGNIYNSSGGLEKSLSVSDAGAAVHAALMMGLADAGLKPIALDNVINPGDLQPGVDAMLSCELQQLTVEKDFGATQTIHGQYFTMTSRVKMKFMLWRRDGSTLYTNEITGAEDEPPKPLGGEVFFPLETDPAESLSVAMSRAIGALVIDPKFRAAFPLRTP
jgi:hypothetical protein